MTIVSRADTNDWQIEEIHTAIDEANTNDFATDAEVRAAIEKWSQTE